MIYRGNSESRNESFSLNRKKEVTSIETITSPRNPKVLEWRSLKDKKGRNEYRAFMIEGPKMVEEAFGSCFPVLSVLIREDYTPPFSIPAGVPVYILTDRVFRSVCDTITPQGIVAVTGMAEPPLRGNRLLALDGIQDPGNMGTIIRTADAAGFGGLILSPDCVDVFSPKVVRATMGSIFRVGFSFPGSLSAALNNFRKEGWSVISSQLDGEPFYSRKSVPPPLILVVGNEGNGISDDVRAAATHRFRLPMVGGAESLNAAVAAGIMMYDFIREDAKN